MRILPVNLDAVLLELDDLPQTLSVLEQLLAAPLPGVEEIVPGARTLLVKTCTPEALPEAVKLIGRLRTGARANRAGRTIEIPVHYDGEDLEEVARLTGIAPEEIVALHTGASYSVAFTGFAPGFAYLTGGDARLHVARRTVPRMRVPAGAVGLAGPFSGIYPRSSPGGWQIIGTTELPMWDLARERPALLQPGDCVRFVRVDAAARSQPSQSASQAGTPAQRAEEAAFEVRQSGLQALFQDLGRPRLAGQGVSCSGAMDRGSLQAANRLVGNEPGAVAIELLGAGFELAVRRDTVLALAGADAHVELQRADRFAQHIARGLPFAVCAGDIVRVAPARAGVRCYLAVRGGFAATKVLGSGSSDTLAGIGPASIKRGDPLFVHAACNAHVVGDPEPVADSLPRTGESVTLDVIMGPRADWFPGAAIDLLCNQLWQVTHESSRVGLRLAGAAPLARTESAAGRELPSEGVSRGAIQVPPSGQPVLFMADHPLTGGYPVIASVASHHLDLAAQLPVGAAVRFRPLAGAAPAGS